MHEGMARRLTAGPACAWGIKLLWRLSKAIGPLWAPNRPHYTLGMPEAAHGSATRPCTAWRPIACLPAPHGHLSSTARLGSSRKSYLEAWVPLTEPNHNLQNGAPNQDSVLRQHVHTLCISASRHAFRWFLHTPDFVQLLSEHPAFEHSVCGLCDDGPITVSIA